MYKRYIKIKGKTYGPYLYGNKRVGKKVISNYLGIGEEKLTIKPTLHYGSYVLLGALFLAVIILILSSGNFTGRATLNVAEVYKLGDKLSGTFSLSLRAGELIPSNSDLKISVGGEETVFALKDLINQSVLIGNYYAENSSLSGTGEGFGVMGKKITTPEIEFQLLVGSSENVSSNGSVPGVIGGSQDSIEVPSESIPSNNTSENSSGNAETTPSENNTSVPATETPVTETPTTQEPITGIPTNPAETPVISEPSNPPATETPSGGSSTTPPSSGASPPSSGSTPSSSGDSSSNSPGNSGNSNAGGNSNGAGNSDNSNAGGSGKGKSKSDAGITGNVLIENAYVYNGKVKSGQDFVYTLEEGQDAELVKGSVKIDGKVIDDDNVRVRVNGRNVTISTNYEVVEEGFGNEFLGDSSLNLKVDLDSFDMIVEGDNLSLSLIYGEDTIASAQKSLVIENVTPANISLIKEIPTIHIPKNGSYALNLSEYFEGAERYVFSGNEVVARGDAGVLVLSPVEGFVGSTSGIIYAYSGETRIQSNEFNILISNGAVNISTSRSIIRVGEPVKWTKTVELEIPDDVIINVPLDADNIKLTKLKDDSLISESSLSQEDVASSITGNVVFELNSEKKFFLFVWLDKLFRSITGNVISEQVDSLDTKEILLEKDSSANEFVVEYDTPAPRSSEKNIHEGKSVTISGPDSVEYTDVIAFAELDDSVPVGFDYMINLTWENGDSKVKEVSDVLENQVVDSGRVIKTKTVSQKKVPFDVYDLNKDGYYDYIEWVVPHLSKQKFNIIYAVEALKLNSSRFPVEDVYPKVKSLDNAFANFNDGEYLRVKFEMNLTSKNDITLYASGSSGNSSVVVYEKDGNEEIARFEQIGNFGMYRVILSGLEGEQDTFDLKIVGDLNVDYVVDPTIYYKGNTPWDQDVINSNRFIVDVGSAASSGTAHYVLTDYDYSLKSWWRGDATPNDDSGNGMTLTLEGGMGYDYSSYKFGYSFFFDGSDDYAHSSPVMTYNSDTSFSVSAWAYISDQTRSGDIIFMGDKDTWGAIMTSLYYDAGSYQFCFGQAKEGVAWDSGSCYGGVNPNQWYHLAGVYNATDGNYVLYVDGSVQSPDYFDYYGDVYQSSSGNTMLGYGYRAGLLKGSVDEVAIFHRALGSDEVLSLYDAYSNQYAHTFSGVAAESHTFKSYAVETDGSISNAGLRTITTSTATDTQVPYIAYVPPTPNQSSVAVGNSIYVNVSSRDNMGDHYVLTNFDNTLRGWWRGETPEYVMYNVLGYTNDVELPSGYIGSSGPGSYGSINLAYTDGRGIDFTSVLQSLDSGDKIVIRGVDGSSNPVDITLIVSDATQSQRTYDEYIIGDLSVTFGDLNGGIYNVTIIPMPEVSSAPNDDSGNGNTLTLYNGASYSAGKFGSAFSFDGSDDYADLGNPSSLQFASGNNFTISAWIYPKADNGVIYGVGWGGYAFYVAGGYLEFARSRTASTNQNTGTTPIPYNTWSHVVVVNRVGTDVAFYINGDLKANPSFGYTYDYGATHRIGAIDGEPINFNGSIDDLIVFNRSLSQSEINSLYSAEVNQYYNDFTGLSSGAHSFKSYAVDLAGNMNNTETRTVTVGGEMIPPNIAFVSPTPDASTTVYVPSIYVNVSSNDSNPHYVVTNFDNSLNGWWKGENNPNDALGKYNGTLAGNTGYATGKFGSAFSFDGSGDYVDLGTANPMGDSVNYTLSAWINPTSNSFCYAGACTEYIIVKGSDTTSMAYGLGIAPVSGTTAPYRASFLQNNGTHNAWATSTSSISSGVWTHVAGVKVGNNFSIYVNGVYEASNTLSNMVTSSTNTLWIGRQNRAGYSYDFGGAIDEVLMINRSLSAQEVKALYDAKTNQYYNNFTVTYGTHTFQAYAVDNSSNMNTTGARSVQANIPLSPGDISSCGVISSPGVYNLTTNLASDGMCLNITSSNVTLQGNGKIIDGDASGTSTDWGIFASNVYNITINNTVVKEFYHGIYFNFTNSSLISNSNLSYNSYYDIFIYSGNFNNISSNNFSYTGTTGRGVVVHYSLNNSIFSNTLYRPGVYGNGYGILLHYSNNSIIYTNNLTHLGAGNNQYPIFSQYGYNTNVSFNIVNSTGDYGFGIYSSYENSVKLMNNIVTTSGGYYNYGLYLYSLVSSTISNNIVTTISSGWGYGIYLGASNSLFYNNNITTFGSSSPGIYIPSPNAVYDNTFMNNNISSPISNEITDLSGDTYTNYFVYNNSFGIINWTNNTNGRFLKNMTLNGTGLYLGGSIIIGNNSVEVNSSNFNVGFINSSANVTLFGIGNRGFGTPAIFKNGVVCSDCYNFTALNASTVIFNVSSWSNYSIGDGDSTPPIVAILYPGNSTYASVTTLNSTASDPSLSSCWYTLNGGTTNVSFTCNTNVTGLTAITGLNNWTVWANDTSGNKNSSRVFFTLDNLPPQITIVNPLNQTYNTSLINFNVTTSKSANCNYTLNGGVTNYTMLANATNTGFGASNSSIYDGQYTVRFYCADTLGNLNSSVTRVFTVDALSINYCKELSVANRAYSLFGSIANASGTCFSITADNVSLNGNGYTVDGDDSGTDYGVWVVNMVNTTIKNLIFTDFYSGIMSAASMQALSNTKNNISNITSFSNTRYGIYLQISSNNTISNVNTSGNGFYGLYVDSASNNNTITNVTSSNNNFDGIFISMSSNNTFSNLNLDSNGYGLYAYLALNNLFTNLNASTNTNSGIYTDYTSNNNNFTNVNLLSNQLGLALYGGNNNTFNSIKLNSNSAEDLRVGNYSNASFVDYNITIYNISYNSFLSLTNTTYGKIDFLSGINGTGAILNNVLNFSNNSATVNSAVSSGFNRSANVTLYGIGNRGTNPTILKNGVQCSDCYNFTALNASTVIFNVTGWSNYSIGSDTTAPQVIFISQNPADINVTNFLGEGGVNITYNISDVFLNQSSIKLYYKANSTASDKFFSLNGTVVSSFQEKLSGSNNSLSYLWTLYDNNILPASYNLVETWVENATHTAVPLTQNSHYVSMELLNVTQLKYGWFEAMLNRTSGTGDLRVYYCNSSYAFASNPANSAYCYNFYSVTNSSYNHAHSGNSNHVLIPFSVNETSGRIGTVYVTSTSYFLLRGRNGDTWNYYNVSNVTRTNTLRTTSNSGSSWTSQAYSIDAHLHQFGTNTSLWYYVCANDSANNQNCSSLRQDLLEFAGLPPTSPQVYSPANTTYYKLQGNISINYSEAVSPNSYYISSYNISLLNSDNSFNQTIVSNNSNRLNYSWNASSLPDGLYQIEVEACDTLLQCSSGVSEMFTYSTDMIAPIINFTSPTPDNNTVSSNNFIKVNTNVTDSTVKNHTYYLYNSSGLVDTNRYYSEDLVASGNQHTCVLTNNGNVQCYGRNNYGQVTNYTGGDAIGITAGNDNYCVLKSNGNTQCYGFNLNGESTNYTGGDAIGISSGSYHSCVLKNNGNVQCYGSNSNGQVANYSGGNAVGVSTGDLHTCVLKNNGKVQCWGDNSALQSTNYTGGDAIGISAGYYFTCILKNNGNVQCWGNNGSGQSNNYTGGDAIGISAGAYHSCFLKSNNTVYCQGYNGSGQSESYSNGDVIGVSTGVSNTCVLKNNGNVQCWGLNDYGQSNSYLSGNVQRTKFYTFQNLASGVYYLNATVYDAPGSRGNSETRIISIDGNAPQISFIAPTPNNASLQTDTSIYVNVSSSDSNQHYVVNNFDNSLVGWYRLDNSSSAGENSTRVYDWSGLGNNGTVSNAIWTAAGKFGGAYTFDGNGDWINISDSSSLRPNVITLSAWFKPSASTTGAIISKAQNGPSWSSPYVSWLIRYNSPVQLEYDVGNSVTYTGQTVAVSNLGTSWHHVSLTYNGSLLSAYLDGVNIQNFTNVVGNIAYAATPVMIGADYGASPAGDYFNGSIDDVMIFNRSLSSQEILALYDASVNRYYNNFTGLSYGNHTFKSYAVDLAGNMNSTELRTVGVVTQILSGCINLNNSGAIYILSGNVTSTGTCFNVQANNVTLDCNGYSVNYSTGGTLGYGVNVTGYNTTTIKNCNIYEGSSSTYSKHGINFVGAYNGTIQNNNITIQGTLSVALALSTSSNNNISKNIITTPGTNGYGVWLNSGSNNTVYYNNITTSGIYGYGIDIDSSSNNNLVGNRVNSSGSNSYFIYGTGLAHFNQSIDSSNLAEGKPVNYTWNVDNTIYNGIDYTSYGEVMFGWSRNITISNSNFSSDSLNLFYTNTSRINNNNFTTSTGYGIFVAASANSNNISSNSIVTSGINGYGIFLYYALNNNLSHNVVTTSGSSAGYASFLLAASSNTLINNSLNVQGGSGMGMFIYASSNSNNFVNNSLTISGTNSRGVYLITSNNNNTFSGLKIISGGAGGYAGFDIVDSNHNFTISDSIINASASSDFSVGVAVAGGTWNLTNVTRLDGNPINVSWGAGANGTLNMKWYLDVAMNTSTGSIYSGVNVSGRDVNNNLVFTNLTNSTGGFARQTLLQYTRNGTSGATTTYLTNYTVNASKSGLVTSAAVNLTRNYALTLTLADSPPNAAFVSPSPLSGQVLGVNTTILNLSVSDNNNATYSFFRDGLVAWYRLDNSSAVGENNTRVYDWSGLGSTGTVNGANWTAAGKFNGAYDFYGTGINASITATLSGTAPSQFTYSAWFKLNSLGTEKHIVELGGTQFYAGTNNKLGTAGWSTAAGATTLAAGVWYQGVLVRNSTNVSLYLNGNLEGIGSLGGNANTNIYIGRYYSTGNYYFNGSIDEVMIFNRTLNSSEIWALYNSSQYGLVRNVSSLLEGSQNYTTETIDDAGNRNTTNLLFSTDYTIPFVNFTGVTPSDGSFVNTSSFVVNMTSSDANNHYSLVNFDNTLLAYWRGENNPNDTLLVNNGTWETTAAYEPGKFGNAFSFSNSRINSASLAGVQQHSVSMWIYNHGYSDWTELAMINNNFKFYVTGDTEYPNNNRLVGYEYNASGWNSAIGLTTIPHNTWVYVAMTYDGNNLSVYVNGVHDMSKIVTRTSTNANPFSLGRDSSGVQPYQGAMDEVMLFNRSLSSAEILSLYNASVNKYYNNFTGLTNGAHTIKGYAVDLAGNINSTAQRTVNVDSLVPEVNFTSPTPDNGTIYSNTTIKVNTNTTDSTIKNHTYYLYNSTGLVATNRYYSENRFSAGNAFTCLLKNDGNTLCYGVNGAGQSANYSGGDAIGVSAGNSQNCILKSNGNVQCYGWNYYGQSNNYSGGDAIGVSAGGYHTCILKSNGNVQCYGDNVNGQSNNYTGGDAIGVSAGYNHNCILKSNGNVQCYGDNTYGKSNNYSGGDAIGVSAGVYQTCVLKSNGNTQCYGWDTEGEIVNYSGGDAIGVSAGYNSNCVLKSNGNTQCYGDNSYGQSNNYSGGDAIGVSVGDYHTCILKSNGNVQCFGLNTEGEIVNYSGGDAKRTKFYTFQNLVDGDYYLNATVYDSSGLSGSSETRKINIDTTLPQIRFVAPTPDNGSSQDATSIYVNVSSSDANQHYVVNNFDNSLVGYWRGENNANDVLGVNNGSLNGDTNYSAGKFGNAFNFDGDGDYVSASDSNLPAGNSPRSISLWIKPTLVDSNYHPALYYGTYSENAMTWVGIASDNTYSVSQYGSLLSGTEAVQNTWAHVVVTYDGTDYRIYINGTLANSGPMATDTVLGGSLLMGIEGGASTFTGNVDDVMIFNRTLSEQEVLALYDASANQYYNDFTSLTAGSHTFKSYAVDVLGNLNSTELRTVSLMGAIPDCMTISLPGRYAISNDILAPNTQDCILIDSDNVYLEGNGHTITYGSDDYAWNGIRVNTNYQNSTIRNVTLLSFNVGVYLDVSSMYSNVSYITAQSNRYGVYTNAYSMHNNISNITALNNIDAGISSYWSSYNTLSNITAVSNGYGIYSVYDSYNNISNITAVSNSYGIYLSNSQNNSLSNLAPSSNSVWGILLDSGSVYNNISNITAVSNGYGIGLSWSDYNNITSMNSSSNSYGVYLSNSYYNNISSVNSSGGNTGLYLSGAADNNFSNLNLRSASYGIQSYSTMRNNFSNINASYNTLGWWASYSTYNRMINSIINSNVYGIYLHTGSSSNNFSNINASYSLNTGVYLNSASFNNFTNLNASNNTISGVSIVSSNNNTFSSVISKSNNYYGIYLANSAYNVLGVNSTPNNVKDIYCADPSPNNNTGLIYATQYGCIRWIAGFDTTAPLINFTSPTPDNGSTITQSNISVNVSSSDNFGDHFILTNFDNSLVSWYKFENNVIDSAGTVNGTIVGTVSYNPGGAFGNGAGFSYGRIKTLPTDNSSVMKISNNFSISFWIRTTDPQSTMGGSVFGVGESDSIMKIVFEGGTHNLRMLNVGWLTGRAEAVLSANGWQHVVYTFNGTTNKMYVNGTLANTGAPYEGTLGNSSGKFFYIGYQLYNGYLGNAVLDEFIILNRTLNAQEVAGLYNATANQYYNNFTNLSAGRHTFQSFASDISGNSNSTELRTILGGVAPSTVTVRVNASSGTNYTNENLSCYANITDADGGNVYANYTWYKNGVANLSGRSGAFVQSTFGLVGILTDGNTTKGDNWSCSVLAFDGDMYGSGWVNSSNLTILNSLPVVTLSSPADGALTTNRTPLFNWTATDADGDTMTYEINITPYFGGGFVSGDNRYVTSIANLFYVPTSDLRYLYDNLYYYKWQVRANDSQAFGAWTGLRNVNISAIVSLSLLNNSIDFGFKNISYVLQYEDDTSDDSPKPILMENTGNSKLNVSLNSTALFRSSITQGGNYRFKVDYAPGFTNAFNWAGSTTAWTNVSLAGETLAINSLNYSSPDRAEIDIYVRVPTDEPPGARAANMTVFYRLGE